MTKSANTDNHLTGRHDKQETIWCYKFVLLSHDKVTWCRTQRFDCFLKKTCSKQSKRCVLHQVTLSWDNRTNLWYHPTTTMNNSLFHNKKRFVTNKTEKSPSLEILQQHRVNAKSKSLPPNRCSTHHVLNFLDKNVCLPAVCPDRRYTHRSGRSGLWRCWNENRNITSQVSTRAKLNMTRKENKLLMQSENPIFLLDSIYRMKSWCLGGSKYWYLMIILNTISQSRRRKHRRCNVICGTIGACLSLIKRCSRA